MDEKRKKLEDAIVLLNQQMSDVFLSFIGLVFETDSLKKEELYAFMGAFYQLHITALFIGLLEDEAEGVKFANQMFKDMARHEVTK